MAFRIISLMFVLALVAGACAVSADDGLNAAAGDATAATVAAEESHDDEEATHDDEEASSHDEDEASHDEAVAAGDVDRVIEVSMTELEFSSVEYEVAAGETIRFEVVNEGQVEHEFRLSNAHRIEEHMAAGHDGHDEAGTEEEAGDHEEIVDVVLLLQAGESGDVTFTFPEDTTLFNEVACLIPGHYEAGMKALIVYASA